MNQPLLHLASFQASRWLATALAVLACAATALEAQPPPPQVRFTAARAHDVRRTVRLTGTVEAPRTSVIATEVQGVVGALLAREGTLVEAGAPLVRLRREPVELRLRAARGQLAEADARLRGADLKLTRLRELAESAVVSRQQVDDALFESQAMEGRVAQLEATVAQLERDLANTAVRAPFGGVISAEHTQVGQWLAVGDPVVELVSLDQLDVRIEAPAVYFSALRTGTPAAITLENDDRPPRTGTVRAVVPRADPQARTFPVLVRLRERDPAIGVGMLAQVDLPVGQPEPAVIVPKDALVRDTRGVCVYVLDDGDAVSRVAVEAGAGLGAWLTVRGELAAGDRVVTRGNERLVNGQVVRADALEIAPP